MQKYRFFLVEKLTQNIYAGCYVFFSSLFKKTFQIFRFKVFILLYNRDKPKRTGNVSVLVVTNTLTPKQNKKEKRKKEGNM